MAKPRTHDDYLAALPADQRAALQHLREVIAAAAPGAREVFAYGVPAFRVGPGAGKVLVGYAAMKAHCGFYAFEGDLIGRFADRLAGFSTAKGTVRFTPETPLPDALVREMIAARLAEIG